MWSLSSDNANECRHTSVEYGPCMTNESFQKDGCKYKTFVKDYQISGKGSKDEQIYIDKFAEINYQNEFSQWLHLNNLKTKKEPKDWRPCEYFDQIKYSPNLQALHFQLFQFLAFLPNTKTLHPRQLLVLDEGHLLETEIVKFRGLSLSKRRWKRYIQNLELIDYGYDNIEKWIDFLIELETKMLTLVGNTSVIELRALQRKIKYNWDGVQKEN